jgi:hypothetical protein
MNGSDHERPYLLHHYLMMMTKKILTSLYRLILNDKELVPDVTLQQQLQACLDSPILVGGGVRRLAGVPLVFVVVVSAEALPGEVQPGTWYSKRHCSLDTIVAGAPPGATSFDDTMIHYYHHHLRKTVLTS